jgi:hypothetical protein
VNHSARRINALSDALALSRYLEIGVSEGDTFRSVKLANRTGVDPRFKFDITTLADENTLFFSETSDDFFRPTRSPRTIYFLSTAFTPSNKRSVT